MIGASVTDYGAIWAQDHLRKALGIAGARVLDAELPVAQGAASASAPTASWSIRETRERLAELLEGLVAHFEQSAKRAGKRRRKRWR